MTAPGHLRLSMPRLACALALLAGALAPLPAARAGTAFEEGVASWYGGKFHGRPTASGERFDKEQMTAAHRTLPFGTLVKVVNRDTGATAVVRVNDRGPFVKGRVLDCSERAARELGFWGAGTARVRLEPLGMLAAADGGKAHALTRKERKRLDREMARVEQASRASEPVPEGLLVPVDDEAGPFEIQVGAFKEAANAERLAERLRQEGHEARLIATPEGFTRVRVGPYPNRREAERSIVRLDIEEMPFVVRRD